MIVGARSLYAFSREWPFLSLTAGWDARRGTPLLALLAQSAIALGLVALAAVEEGGVRMMVEFTAPVFWAFLVLVGLGFFVLRRRFPGAPRPFTVPGYPVLPLVFIATCAYLFYSSLVYARSQHAVQVSFYLMAVGLVAWAIARGAGADVNAPLRDGTTPLMILAGQGDPALFRRYLERGADAKAKDRSGRTALHRAQTPDIVDLLVGRGADVHARDQHGRTPLLAAGRRDVMEALLKHGADVKARDAEGRSAVALNLDPDALTFLVAHGADPNVADGRGRTPLMLAAENGDAYTVQALLKLGVDVNAVSKERETALSLARKKGAVPVGQLLVAAGAR